MSKLYVVLVNPDNALCVTVYVPESVNVTLAIYHGFVPDVKTYKSLPTPNAMYMFFPVNSLVSEVHHEIALVGSPLTTFMALD